jgi:Glycosyl hydrolase family 99/Calcineurin-like phosphoesterase
MKLRIPLASLVAAVALGFVAAVGLAAATPVHSSATAAARSAPVRAAFYYPWYPSTWHKTRYTRYRPSLGLYSSSSGRVIRRHIAAMRYAGLNAAIASWWGPGDRTARALDRILSVSATASKKFRWAVYYEREGHEDPSVDELRRDLQILRVRYGKRSSYLKIRKRFVVFVWADGGDGCDMAQRWRQANTVGAYVVLKVFSGYRSCSAQPDGWHQYAPDSATDHQRGYSYSISPGFWKGDEGSPRLARSLARWRRDVRAMAASRERFQLVTTFNEWGEGTAVESAAEWRSVSGHGAYLDVLHKVLNPTGHRHKVKKKRNPPPRHRHPPRRPPRPAPKGGANLIAAGDVASCQSRGDEATARLIGRLRGTVAVLGDAVYEEGSAQQFASCYAPSWGRYKSRTRPAVGNHEYLTPDAAGYFRYFGAAAGARGKGYYSYNLGAWHVVVLNANCSQVSCSAGSPQERWLRADLASHRTACTLAYWHQPRFSSGQHGDHDEYTDFWRALYAARVEVVLNGHDHDYERFKPLNPAGAVDAARGIVEFVAGTGGKNHYGFSGAKPARSVVRNDDTFGVLVLTLRAGGYSWRFVPEAGKTFTDAGSAPCH